MKVAILSDIHGNIPALETVTADIEAWQPDYVIVNGDVVNRGPCPLETWHFIAKKQAEAGWLVTQGNHESYVIKHSQPDAIHEGLLFQVNYLSYWTFHKMNGRVAPLTTLPAHVSLYAPDGSELRATHASMRSNRDAMTPTIPLDQTRQQIAPAPAVFCTAHIHHPFIRYVDNTLIVNSGSAGQQCYGDTRATYARLLWQQGRWYAKIIKLSYDMAATDRHFYTSGYLDETGPVAHLIYHEWRTGQNIVRPWVSQIQPHVLSGKIELETAVNKYLIQLGLLNHT